MKEYHIVSLPGHPSEATVRFMQHADIDCYPWGGDYRPKAFGTMWVEGGKKLCARMCCEEEEPRAVLKNFGDPVCTDSCLEWFMAADKEGNYLNCEMNAIGTVLVEYGPQNGQRGFITEIADPPVVKAGRDGVYWYVEVGFELDLLRKALNAPELTLDGGSEIWFNMYKCGDRTEHRHFGVWNEVGTSGPNFHTPKYFGKGIVQN